MHPDGNAGMKYARLDTASSFRVRVLVVSACDGTIANRRTCFINVRVPWPTRNSLGRVSFVQSSSTYVLCRENEIILWDLYRTSCKVEGDGEFALIFNNYDLLNRR